MSAIYHDVVKDRLYTDAANSARRRSTQTTLYRVFGSLCRMLTPLLSFTADEAWEFAPGGKGTSAHELTWEPMRFQRTEKEYAVWKKLFELRELALPELEKARQAKAIGKALEARLTISGAPQALAEALGQEEALRELLNVSQLELLAVEGGPTAVTVSRAAGQKCERCWHWETDVGSHPEHPTICHRCVQAVQAGKA